MTFQVYFLPRFTEARLTFLLTLVKHRLPLLFSSFSSFSLSLSPPAFQCSQKSKNNNSNSCHLLLLASLSGCSLRPCLCFLFTLQLPLKESSPLSRQMWLVASIKHWYNSSHVFPYYRWQEQSLSLFLFISLSLSIFLFFSFLILDTITHPAKMPLAGREVLVYTECSLVTCVIYAYFIASFVFTRVEAKHHKVHLTSYTFG